MERRMVVGALVGWKRQGSENGTVITLKVQTVGMTSDRQYVDVAIALNDRQIRSLTRDMQRAAAGRGITLWSQPKWWRALLTLGR
jgi:uncharacterized Ntn-hydrolase superfamily protein